MSFEISNPFPVFTDLDGSPLENGNIFIGVVDLNPETNPVSVFFDEALTIPALQPIRTIAGYPSRDGTPSNLFVTDLDLSITVRNKNNKLVFSDLDANEIPRLVLIDASTLTNISEMTALVKDNLTNGMEVNVSGYFTQGDGGGGRFYWTTQEPLASATVNGGTIIAAGEGGTGRWIRIFTKLNPIMFGSIGDGATDDSIAVQDIIDTIGSSGIELDWLEKTYRLGSAISAEYDDIFWTGNGNLNIDHAGVGVELGGTSGRSRHFRVTLGKVTTTGSTYASGSVGIRIRNFSFWTLRFGHIEGTFEKGLSIISSDGEGVSYGDVEGQRITSNKFGVHVTTESGTFANDVTYRINRIGNTSSDPDSSGGYHVYLDGAGGGNIPGAHRFFGTTFESPAITAGNLEAAFYDDGTRNETIGCYFEGSLGWDLFPTMIKQGPNYDRDSVYHFAKGFNGLANVDMLSATGRTTILAGSTLYFGGGDGVDPHFILQERNNNTNVSFESRDTSGAATFQVLANGQIGVNGKTPAAPPDYTLGTYTTRKTVPDASSITLQQAGDVLGTIIQDLIDIGLYQ